MLCREMEATHALEKFLIADGVQVGEHSRVSAEPLEALRRKAFD